jgi:hypothetical protein
MTGKQKHTNMKYPNTIQLPKLKIRDKHSVVRMLSPERFNLTEQQISRLRHFNFTEFERESITVEKHPQWRKKMRDGYRYYKNEHLNMVLCVSNDGYLVTVLKFEGTDYSDYNNRKGWDLN